MADPDPDDALTFRSDRDKRGVFNEDDSALQFRAPADTKKPDEDRDYEWHEVPGEMIRHIPHSAAEFAKNLTAPIHSPIKTYNALKLLGSGVMSKIGDTKTIRNRPADPQGEAAVDALKDFYVQRYGSEKGFRKALATDPVGLLADASTVVTAGGSAAARIPGAVGRAGEAVAAAGNAANPINLALKAVKVPKDYALELAMKKAINPALAWKNGVPIESHNAMLDAGKTGNAAAKAQMTGRAPPSDIVDKAMSAADKLAQQRSREYFNSMQGIKANKTPLPFTEIDNALAKAKADAMHGQAIKDPAAYKMAELMEDAVLDWKTHPQQPGIINSNIEGLDALKRLVGVIGRDDHPNIKAPTGDSAQRVANQVYGAIKKTITDHDPNYEDVMGAYGDASDQLAQMSKTLKLNGKAPVDQQLRQILLAAKQGGHKGTLLSELDQVEPGLSQMVAGHLLQPSLPQGLRGSLGAAILGAVPATILGATGGEHALAQGAIQAANVATSVPRLAGHANYAAGRNIGSKSGFGVPWTLPAMAAYSTDRGIAPAPEKEKARPFFAPGEWEDPPTQGTNTNPVWDRMLKIESGGRQFGADGQPLISPKGAVGVAQVMPSTAQDVARSRGEAYNHDGLLHDPAYNTRMGRAYYDDMVKQFNDPHVAAAAYNAGPGRVREAQAQAEKTQRPYTEFLPAETRDYLTQLDDDQPEPVARKSGGRVMRHAHEAEKLIAAAERAKKFHVKHTAPLLQKSDETITHALKIADANI